MTDFRIVNSALWAAAGDALGFQTELADKALLRRRGLTYPVDGANSWSKRVGGAYGVDLELPAGCYSDDTQLRLATSRCLSGSQFFDIEAFARIELPVWLGYSLGGGRSTKAAAKNLALQSVNWFSNFYADKGVSYWSAGGNGVAMRVQPHAWRAVHDRDLGAMGDNIVRNAITTHGHFGAILGAIFHALCLHHTIVDGEIPAPRQWYEIVRDAIELWERALDSEAISDFWTPLYRQRLVAGMSEAPENSIDEMMHALGVCQAWTESSAATIAELISELGAFDESRRGSGILTSVIALGVSWRMRGSGVRWAVLECANCLGSDTDSIATMVGAILGSIDSELPTGWVMDEEYIREEALRLCHNSIPQFRHPSLSSWRIPKAAGLHLLVSGGTHYVRGLGSCRILRAASAEKSGFSYSWVRTSFGQSLVMKHRSPIYVSDDIGGLVGEGYVSSSATTKATKSPGSPSLAANPCRNIDELCDLAAKANFDASTIGAHLHELSLRDRGIEDAVAYAAILSRAIRQRSRKMQSKVER